MKVIVDASANLKDMAVGTQPDRLGQLVVLRRSERHPGPEYALIAPGYGRAMVERVARLIKINEYKRRQAPVGIRVTHRSFGKDWRYPITSKFNETAGKPKP